MKKLVIDAKELDYWNALLKESHLDLDEMDFPRDEMLFCKTVRFGDGVEADLKVCSGMKDLWCEMVWFDENGYQMACSDASADELDGTWEYPLYDAADGVYDIEVVRG